MLNGLYVDKEERMQKDMYLQCLYIYRGEGLSKGSHIWLWYDGWVGKDRAPWYEFVSYLSPEQLEFTGVTVSVVDGVTRIEKDN